jgi:hypothetical protein
MDPLRHNEPGTTENPVVLPTKEARQGNPGFPVLNVLVGGLVLVIIAFVIVYFAVPPS